MESRNEVVTVFRTRGETTALSRLVYEFDPDAHRDDEKRLVVHADEKLTAFVELEAAICN